MTRPAAGDIRSYAGLAADLCHRTPPFPVRLVAIDGPGGSGKSMFAGRLSAALGGAPVLHTDDFASHEQPIQWWPLFEEWVLGPLAAGRPARFRRYDWLTRRRVDWQELPAAPVVLIEGVSSARRTVRARLTVSVWLETGPAERLRRGLERDGQALAGFWAAWMAAEDEFYAGDPVRDAVDLVVDGAPRCPHDPDREFVVIRP